MMTYCGSCVYSRPDGDLTGYCTKKMCKVSYGDCCDEYAPDVPDINVGKMQGGEE